MGRLTLADITPARLADFPLLAEVAEDKCREMIQDSLILRLNPGDWLLKPRLPADSNVFLLQGEIEVQESGTARSKLQAGGLRSRDPLEDMLRPGCTMRALDDVTLLAIPRKSVEKAASAPDLMSFTIEYTPVADVVKDAPRPAQKYTEDWMTRIQKSPLLAEFSPSDIQRFFMELERVEHKAGDDIVTLGLRGDYFYILFEGTAEVITDPQGPYAGARFELQPGAHFGEEALVADTPRNATVRMKTDGAIGRLAKPEFDRLIRDSIVQVVDFDKAVAFFAGSGTAYEVLDVRSEAEFAGAHRAGARNLPIQLLRKAIPDLPADSAFLLTPEGGRRSQLGVFLLRQAGFGAYLLHN